MWIMKCSKWSRRWTHNSIHTVGPQASAHVQCTLLSKWMGHLIANKHAGIHRNLNQGNRKTLEENVEWCAGLTSDVLNFVKLCVWYNISPFDGADMSYLKKWFFVCVRMNHSTWVSVFGVGFVVVLQRNSQSAPLFFINLVASHVLLRNELSKNAHL